MRSYTFLIYTVSLNCTLETISRVVVPRVYLVDLVFYSSIQYPVDALDCYLGNNPSVIAIVSLLDLATWLFPPINL